MSGDYNKYRRHYQDISLDYDLAATTGGPVTLKAVRNSAYTIYIQRISTDVKTYAAKTLTFEDSGTPTVIAVDSIPAAEPTNAGAQSWDHDFGPVGTALGEGKDLVLALSASGVAARIHIEGYQRRTKVGFMGDGLD